MKANFSFKTIKTFLIYIVLIVISYIIATISDDQISFQNSVIRIFFLYCGYYCIYNGVNHLVTYFKEQHNEYHLVSGKIISFKEVIKRHHNGDRTTFYPIFEYDYNGQTYQGCHWIGKARLEKGVITPDDSKYKIGQEVNIRVYLDTSIGAKLDNSIKNHLWLGIVCIILGCVIAILFGTSILKILCNLS